MGNITGDSLFAHFKTLQSLTMPSQVPSSKKQAKATDAKLHEVVIGFQKGDKLVIEPKKSFLAGWLQRIKLKPLTADDIQKISAVTVDLTSLSLEELYHRQAVLKPWEVKQVGVQAVSKEPFTDKSSTDAFRGALATKMQEMKQSIPDEIKKRLATVAQSFNIPPPPSVPETEKAALQQLLKALHENPPSDVRISELKDGGNKDLQTVLQAYENEVLLERMQQWQDLSKASEALKPLFSNVPSFESSSSLDKASNAMKAFIRTSVAKYAGEIPLTEPHGLPKQYKDVFVDAKATLELAHIDERLTIPKLQSPERGDILVGLSDEKKDAALIFMKKYPTIFPVLGIKNELEVATFRVAYRAILGSLPDWNLPSLPKERRELTTEKMKELTSELQNKVSQLSLEDLTKARDALSTLHHVLAERTVAAISQQIRLVQHQLEEYNELPVAVKDLHPRSKTVEELKKGVSDYLNSHSADLKLLHELEKISLNPFVEKPLPKYRASVFKSFGTAMEEVGIKRGETLFECELNMQGRIHDLLYGELTQATFDEMTKVKALPLYQLMPSEIQGAVTRAEDKFCANKASQEKQGQYEKDYQDLRVVLGLKPSDMITSQIDRFTRAQMTKLSQFLLSENPRAAEMRNAVGAHILKREKEWKEIDDILKSLMPLKDLNDEFQSKTLADAPKVIEEAFRDILTQPQTKESLQVLQRVVGQCSPSGTFPVIQTLRQDLPIIIQTHEDVGTLYQGISSGAPTLSLYTPERKNVFLKSVHDEIGRSLSQMTDTELVQLLENAQHLPANSALKQDVHVLKQAQTERTKRYDNEFKEIIEKSSLFLPLPESLPPFQDRVNTYVRLLCSSFIKKGLPLPDLNPKLNSLFRLLQESYKEETRALDESNKLLASLKLSQEEIPGLKEEMSHRERMDQIRKYVDERLKDPVFLAKVKETQQKQSSVLGGIQAQVAGTKSTILEQLKTNEATRSLEQEWEHQAIELFKIVAPSTQPPLKTAKQTFEQYRESIQTALQTVMPKDLTLNQVTQLGRLLRLMGTSANPLPMASIRTLLQTLVDEQKKLKKSLEEFSQWGGMEKNDLPQQNGNETFGDFRKRVQNDLQEFVKKNPSKIPGWDLKNQQKFQAEFSLQFGLLHARPRGQHKTPRIVTIKEERKPSPESTKSRPTSPPVQSMEPPNAKGL